MYQRSNEKVNTSNNRINNDTSRAIAGGLKQQQNSQTTQPGVPGGLAAAMNNASKQEIMMPGHRPREKASGMFGIL
jgi:hypothetical protein